MRPASRRVVHSAGGAKVGVTSKGGAMMNMFAIVILSPVIELV
jgi:hypothetical protein